MPATFLTLRLTLSATRDDDLGLKSDSQAYSTWELPLWQLKATWAGAEVQLWRPLGPQM